MVSVPQIKVMFRFLLIALLVAVSSAFMAPISQRSVSKVAMSEGKGFGGGEATRDPEPTFVDPNDPKGKQRMLLQGLKHFICAVCLVEKR